MPSGIKTLKQQQTANQQAAVNQRCQATMLMPKQQKDTKKPPQWGGFSSVTCRGSCISSCNQQAEQMGG
ncbi:MAG: hypothetical protein ACO23C_08345, partial [Prochlorococcaceae cyanobacterium]